MPSRIKLVLAGMGIFSAGVAVGSGVTYKIMKDKTEKKISEECGKIRKWYNDKFSGKTWKLVDPLAEDKPDDGKKTPKNYITSQEYRKALEEKNYKDYTSYSISVPAEHHSAIEDMKNQLDQLSKEVHDDDLDEHMAEREHPVDEDEAPDEETQAYLDSLAENERISQEKEEAIREGRAPYFIELSDFANQKLWYEKLCWTYYYSDDIVGDEDEKPLDKETVFKYIPENFKTYLENDEGVARFRNDAKQTDVEIVRVDWEYKKPDNHDTPTVTYMS